MRLSPGKGRTPALQEPWEPPGALLLPGAVTYIGANRSLWPLRARLPRQPLPGKRRHQQISAPWMLTGIFSPLVFASECPRSPHVSPWQPRASQGCSSPSLLQPAPALTFGPKEPGSPSGPGFPREPFGNIWKGGVMEVLR